MKTALNLSFCVLTQNREDRITKNACFRGVGPICRFSKHNATSNPDVIRHQWSRTEDEEYAWGSTGKKNSVADFHKHAVVLRTLERHFSTE